MKKLLLILLCLPMIGFGQGWQMLVKETKPKTNTPLIEIYDDGTVEKRIVIE